MTNLERIQKEGRKVIHHKLTTSQCMQMLTLLDVNRDINPRHKAQLKKWLIQVAKTGKFGSIPPLLAVVDKEKDQVILIDGYHRLLSGNEILSEEGLEVEYTIAYMEVDDIPEAIRVFNNTQLSWKTPDYIKHNVALGNEDYITLEQFITLANNMLTVPRGFGVQSAVELINGVFPAEAFRKGNLKISKESMDIGMRNLNELYQLQSALINIGLKDKAAKVVSRGACAAFYKIHADDNFKDIGHFINKVLQHPTYISDNTEYKSSLTAYEIILKA